MTTGRSPLEVKVDGLEFTALFGKSSKVSPKLRTALRKRLRTAGEEAAAQSRSEVLKPPMEAGKNRRHRGLRQGIAAGISVKIETGTNPRRAGVKILAKKSSLPEDMRPLVKAYERGKWRHPVFASYAHKGLGAIAKDKSISRDTRSGAGKLRRALRSRARGRATWVEQTGRPYFDDVITAQADNVQAAVLDAMKEAIESLTQGT